MSAKVIDGKAIAQQIADELQIRVEQLKSQNIEPKLVIVGVTPDPRSSVYIKMKLQRAKSLGILAEFVDIGHLPQVKQQEFIEGMGQDDSVHGIIIQLPISGWYDAQDLLDCVPASKDVDGISSASQAALENGEPGFVPATPLGVMQMLHSAEVEIAGKTACIIGRSNLVGKPLAILLEQAGAKVLVGHRQVPDLSAMTRSADILIAAAGSPGLVTAEMIKSGAVVIDVGINDIDGKLKGDVEFDAASKVASAISPVPGGVGPLTVVMLLSNVVNSAANSAI